MAPVAQRRFDDDEKFFDSAIYDPAYYPKRVYRDGKGPTVRLMLTDAAPSAISDGHRPHQIGGGLGDADAEKDAAAAYRERSAYLENAWRSPDNPPPPPLKKGESARAAYIARISSAWRWRSPPSGLPAGSPFAGPAPLGGDAVDVVQALTQRRQSPGARASEEGESRRGTADADSARAQADQAYAEYCTRLQSAWKTR